MELFLQTLRCFYNKDYGIIPSHPSHHASFLTRVSGTSRVNAFRRLLVELQKERLFRGSDLSEAKGGVILKR